MPPMLDGEDIDQYTDRLTGADKTDRRPYDHHRNRQCSIGFHDECTDPKGDRCKCPCHDEDAKRKLGILLRLIPGLERVIELYDKGEEFVITGTPSGAIFAEPALKR